jgi:amino acid adenylation domain-containing protein
MIKIKNLETSFPLSQMQRGMLFQCQLAARGVIYVLQWVITLHEEVNVPYFIQAWNDVLARHDVLRSAFRWADTEEPMQDIYTDSSIPCEQQDWQQLSATEQKNKLEEFLKLDRKKGFNLNEAPLMRLTLIRLGENHYHVVWTAHHMIISNRSNRIVLEEAFKIYDAYCQGSQVTLPETRPYRDYIDWLQQQDTSKSEGYWRELLKGFTTPTPVGPPQTANDLYKKEAEFGLFEVFISEKVTASLQALAKENHITLNTILQGAWALLLNRYSGEEDIVFGEVRANRKWDIEAEVPMVGLMLNTLPLRVNTAPEKPIIPWLKEIRQQQKALREHENTPLIDIQGWSEVPRGTALFSSICVFDYGDLYSIMRPKGSRWQNVDFGYVPIDAGYPISLLIYAKSTLNLTLNYDKAQFDGPATKHMLEHLKILIDGIAENPNRSLGELPVLSEAERRQILVEWNDTRVDYPRDKLFHQIFEIQVEKTPDATALAFEGERLSYRQLNSRANQLAHYLQSLGVGPESLVGIAMERSLEMVVGLFGIIKAGGAYVPIDPTYPAGRIAYMTEDSNVPVMLTQARQLDKLPTNGSQVVCLDREWDSLIAGQSTENPLSETTLENTAYVIYTSGSTGKPKGAINTHGGILNCLLWMQDTYRLTPSDSLFQKTQCSFDASVWEFFWPPMFGARLVMARPEGHKDSDYLVQTIIEQQITNIFFVPSMLQIFLTANDVEKCESLRQVFCGGEVLTKELQSRFFIKLNANLHDLYGPTETAVEVIYRECQRGNRSSTTTIGRPIANTQIYILDRSMQPVPVGVPGELYIGGVQVGKGYLNRPELTAEKFIPDPFCGNPKVRLYKSGDLARYQPDGNIEFLGRIDFQTKIRGNRVELGEIEAVLNQHSAVNEAVVMVREDTPGNTRLVAYIIPKKTETISTGALRNYVKQKLPDFMVPSHFVTLDRFPLTPSGKTDRMALPAPTTLRPEVEAVYVAPRTETERTMAPIWRAVLHLEKIGINDDFFELGGNSLLATQIVSRVQKAFEINLPLRSFFENPTIAGLAQAVEDIKNSEAALKPQPIVPLSREKRRFTSSR